MRSLPVLLLLLAGTASAQDAPPAKARTAQELIAELKSGDVPARKKAVYALWQLGPTMREGVPELATALTDAEPYVALLASRLLERMGPAAGEAFDPAVAALEDERPKVRLGGVKVLAALGAKTADAAGSLLSRLDDEDVEVRRATAAAFGPMGWSLGGSGFAAQAVSGLAGALEDPDAEVRRAAAFALASYGDRALAAVDALVARLGDASAEVRTFAANTLWSLGPSAGSQALDGLHGLLADPEPAVRGRAYGGIVEMGPEDPRLFGVMRNGMKDADAGVRQTCSWILGQRFLDREGVVALLLAAAGDEAVTVRVNALIGIGKVRPLSVEVLSALRRAFSDGEDQVRSTAARVAGEAGAAGAPLVPHLVDMLSDTETFNERVAITALGEIGPAASEAIPDLRRRWRQRRDPGDRVAAGAALARVSPADREAVLGVFASVLRGSAKDLPVKEVVLWYGTVRPDPAVAVPLLRPLLKDPDLSTRISAVMSLGKIGPAAAEALPDLEPLLRETQGSMARRAREAIDAIRGTPR